MKKIVSLILFIFLITTLCAQEFREIEPQLVAVFPIGNSDSSLGYRNITDGKVDGWPTAFCFDLDGNLVVSDWVNKRMSYFVQNWQPIKTIDLTKDILPTRMEVDNKGNFICYYGSVGIAKINANGNIIFFLHVAGEDISSDIRSDGFYVVDDMVLAYNRNNGGIIGFKDLTPDYKENNKNPILNTQQVIRELERSYGSVQIEKKESVLPSLRTLSSGVPSRAVKDDYVILQDGELLSRDFNTIQQSGSTQSQMLKSTQLESMSEDNDLILLFDKYKDRRSKYYYGKDSDGNNYWELSRKMFVLDANGVPIDAFDLEGTRPRRTTRPVISDNGDIYYMSLDKRGHLLYKIVRDW